MSEYDLHSLILACDFRVDDVDRMWNWLKKHRDNWHQLARITLCFTHRFGNPGEYW